MRYAFRTADGRFLANNGDFLYYLTDDPDEAVRYDSELEASMAFLRLPKVSREGVSGSPVPADSLRPGPNDEEREAAKVFLTCAALVSGASEKIAEALNEMMDSYLTMTKRLRDENAELRYRLESLEK